MREGRFRAILLGVFVILGCALAPTPCYSDVTLSHTFTASNQSIYGPGPAFNFDFNRDFTVSGGGSLTVGGISCFLGACAGIELRGSASATVGLGLGLHLDSGSASAVIPANVGLGFPTVVDGGTSFHVSSTAGFGLGTLRTTSPNVQAFADLILAASASASARACLGGCVSAGGNILDFSARPELVAFNRSNDGQLRIAGSAVPGFQFGQPTDIGSGLGSVTVSVPNLATTGMGFSHIASSGNVNVLNLTAELANIAARIFGLPNLKGSIGPINYNILSAQAIVDLFLREAFSLDPAAHVGLHVAETGQDLFFDGGGGGGNILIPDGFSGLLHITPSIMLDGMFRNMTGFTIDPSVRASGGSFSVSLLGKSISLGPLFDVGGALPGAGFTLFDRTFVMDGFDRFVGTPFTVEVVPEPATLLLLGSGLALLGGRVRRRWKTT